MTALERSCVDLGVSPAWAFGRSRETVFSSVLLMGETDVSPMPRLSADTRLEFLYFWSMNGQMVFPVSVSASAACVSKFFFIGVSARTDMDIARGSSLSLRVIMDARW